MEFIDLYNHVENLVKTRRQDDPLSAPIITISELSELLKKRINWIEDINFHPVECKEGDPYGHYECHGTQEDKYEDPVKWVVLISYDKNLNMCHHRFIWCKELMHIFDTEDGHVKSAQEYQRLLREIELNPLNPSEAYVSENMAEWMALLILCPKCERDIAKKEAEKDKLSYYQVALRYRMPEVVVQSLFSDFYDSAYNSFIGDSNNNKN